MDRHLLTVILTAVNGGNLARLTANAQSNQSCTKPPSQLQTSQHGTILDFVRPSLKPGFTTTAHHSITNKR